MSWEIKEYDGTNLLGSYSVPGNLSRGEIGRILCQLASRHLSPGEVINANLRKRMRGKTSLLEIRHSDRAMQIGVNPFLTAR